MKPTGGPPSTLPWAPLAQGLTALYGLPSFTFREMMFFSVPGDPAVYAVVAGAEHPQSREALLNLGWCALDAPWPDGRPTSAFLAVIGADATRNVVDVDEAAAERFLAGQVIACPPVADADVLIVRRGRRVIGALTRATGRPLAP